MFFVQLYVACVTCKNLSLPYQDSMWKRYNLFVELEIGESQGKGVMVYLIRNKESGFIDSVYCYSNSIIQRKNSTFGFCHLGSF